MLSYLGLALCYPDERLEQSIAQVLTSLNSENSDGQLVIDQKNKRTRPKIITKYDFLQSRHKKSHLELPKEIVISSGLEVGDPETQKEQESPNSRSVRQFGSLGPNSRSGRNLQGAPRRSRKAKANFAIKRAIDNAPVIQGERRPDDYTDRVTHRNGRFINNVFIPNNLDVQLPKEFIVNSEDQKYKVRQSPLASWSMSRSARSHTQAQEPDQGGNTLEERGRGDRNAGNTRGARNLPFSFKFRDYYVGREQDREDTMALESRQDEVYALPEHSFSGRESSNNPNLYTAQASPSLQYTAQAPQTPQYYVNQDTVDLHADRSPYVFEPADTQSTYTDQYTSNLGSSLSGYPGSGQTVLAASNEDFVIKEHTYQMCPGCPTFDIPIPVPRTALDNTQDPINPYNVDPGFEYQHARNSSFLQQIGTKIISTVEPFIKTAKSWITGTPIETFSSNAVDRSSQELQDFSGSGSRQDLTSSTDWSPMWYAGLAAAALGGATIISTIGQISRVGGINLGRDFGEEKDLVTNSIEDLDYDEGDLMCVPRAYCEKVKANNMHTIDQYPNIKMAAKWLLERVFSTDQVYSKKDTPLLNECHLRECLFSLVT